MWRDSNKFFDEKQKRYIDAIEKLSKTGEGRDLEEEERVKLEQIRDENAYVID